MTGKTSLLKEAGRLLQQTQGAQVHFVPLQYVQGGQHEVVREILRTVAERESVTAVRRSKMLDEPLLKSVLQRMSRNSIPTVLILDELGNVLQKEQSRGDWEGLIGMLREFSHNGRLRVLMSGYQEFFIKQSDFEGPFVNLAKFVRLSGFTNPEIDEFLVQPLQFWGNISRTELLTLAMTRVGRHPLLLQYFGKALFEKVARRANGADVNAAAAHLLNSEGIEIFHEPVDELFLRSGPATERFLFLKRCREAELSGEPLCDAELTDEWSERALRSDRLRVDIRRSAADLQIARAASADDRDRLQPIGDRDAAPIIYSCPPARRTENRRVDQHARRGTPRSSTTERRSLRERRRRPGPYDDRGDVSATLGAIRGLPARAAVGDLAYAATLAAAVDAAVPAAKPLAQFGVDRFVPLQPTNSFAARTSSWQRARNAFCEPFRAALGP